MDDNKLNEKIGDNSSAKKMKKSLEGMKALKSVSMNFFPNFVNLYMFFFFSINP